VSVEWDELNEYVSRPWYRYGWDSPRTLYERVQSKWMPVARTRHAWQRVVRGHDDPMLWSLNHALATLTVAGVQYMREAAHGYPAEFSEEWNPDGVAGGWEAWDDILRRIEEGFQAWLDNDGGWWADPAEEEKFKDAMKLYAHWFSSLWD
jgi:hypothetical protein